MNLISLSLQLAICVSLVLTVCAFFRFDYGVDNMLMHAKIQSQKICQADFASDDIIEKYYKCGHITDAIIEQIEQEVIIFWN